LQQQRDRRDLCWENEEPKKALPEKGPIETCEKQFFFLHGARALQVENLIAAESMPLQTLRKQKKRGTAWETSP
jgi:hypothetical protein